MQRGEDVTIDHIFNIAASCNIFVSVAKKRHETRCVVSILCIQVCQISVE